MMAVEGWAYFSVRYLNEMFSIMLERYGMAETDSDEDEEENKVVVKDLIKIIEKTEKYEDTTNKGSEL